MDRKALPEPLKSNDIAFQPLATPTEIALAEIWSTLLDGVEIHGKSHFFHSGGHSLAIQAVSRIREKFGVKLKVADLFAHPTLDAMARRIAAAPNIRQALPPVAPRAEDTAIPLTLEQQSVLVPVRDGRWQRDLNIPAALRLSGKLDVAALERVSPA